MAGRGGFGAITVEALDRMLECTSDDEVFAVFWDLHEKDEILFGCGMDKAWRHLDRCFTDDRFTDQRISHSIILGYEPPIRSSKDYFLDLKDVTSVPRLWEELRPLDEKWLWKRWQTLNHQDHLNGEEDHWEGIVAYFEDMKEFYQRAAEEEAAVYFAWSG